MYIVRGRFDVEVVQFDDADHHEEKLVSLPDFHLSSDTLSRFS